MPQEPFRQVTFNGGELDPRMRARSDIRSYATMMDLALNLSLTPLGPVARRPGSVFVDYVRRRMEAVSLSAGMLTFPNGPDIADAGKALSADGELIQTSIDLGDADHWLMTIDFGAPVEIHAIDLVDYCVKPAGAAVEPPPFTYPYEPPVLDGPIDPPDIDLGFL